MHPSIRTCTGVYIHTSIHIPERPFAGAVGRVPSPLRGRVPRARRRAPIMGRRDVCAPVYENRMHHRVFWRGTCIHASVRATICMHTKTENTCPSVHLCIAHTKRDSHVPQSVARRRGRTPPLRPRWWPLQGRGTAPDVCVMLMGERDINCAHTACMRR